MSSVIYDAETAPASTKPPSLRSVTRARISDTLVAVFRRSTPLA
jgi:hypothetical protein